MLLRFLIYILIFSASSYAFGEQNGNECIGKTGDFKSIYGCIYDYTNQDKNSFGSIVLFEGVPESKFSITFGSDITYITETIGTPKYICKIEKNNKKNFLKVLNKRKNGKFSSKDMDGFECNFESDNKNDIDNKIKGYTVEDTSGNIELLKKGSKGYLHFYGCTEDAKEIFLEITGSNGSGLRFIDGFKLIKDNKNLYKLGSYSSFDNKCINLINDDNNKGQYTLLKSDRIVDFPSLDFIGSNYFRDKNSIYYVHELSDIKFREVKFSDYETFELVGNFGGNAKDKKYKYNYGNVTRESIQKQIKVFLTNLDIKLKNKSETTQKNIYKRIILKVKIFKLKNKKSENLTLIHFLYKEINKRYINSLK